MYTSNSGYQYALTGGFMRYILEAVENRSMIRQIGTCFHGSGVSDLNSPHPQMTMFMPRFSLRTWASTGLQAKPEASYNIPSEAPSIVTNGIHYKDPKLSLFIHLPDPQAKQGLVPILSPLCFMQCMAPYL